MIKISYFNDAKAEDENIQGGCGSFPKTVDTGRYLNFLIFL